MTEQIDSLLERAERDAERIRRKAEQDAEDTRRNAIAAAERLLGRLAALEFPLGQLVVDLREEVEQVARELERGTPVDKEPRADERDDLRDGAGPARHPREELGESTRDEAALIASEAAEAQPRMTVPDVDRRSRGAKPKTGGRLWRRESKPKPEDIFIAVEGSCAICQRSFKAGSEHALASSGWKVSGDVGLCPNCQADRWQLPEGARLPVRQGGS